MKRSVCVWLLSLFAWTATAAPMTEAELRCKRAAALLPKIGCGLGAVGAIGFGYGVYWSARKVAAVLDRLDSRAIESDTASRLRKKYSVICFLLSLGFSISLIAAILNFYQWRAIMAEDIPPKPIDPSLLVAKGIPAELPGAQAHDRALAALEPAISSMMAHKQVLVAAGADSARIQVQEDYIALEAEKLAAVRDAQASDRAYHKERVRLQEAHDEAGFAVLRAQQEEARRARDEAHKARGKKAAALDAALSQCRVQPQQPGAVSAEEIERDRITRVYGALARLAKDAQNADALETLRAHGRLADMASWLAAKQSYVQRLDKAGWPSQRYRDEALQEMAFAQNGWQKLDFFN